MGFTTSPSKVCHLVIPSYGGTVLVLLVGDTGVGQNNENTTDAAHVSLLIRCWTSFFLQYCRNPSWNGLVQVLNSA
jgi:hypothetical protein